MAETAQSWDPDRYARNAGFVPARGDLVLSWLDAQSGEDVLDLGCGDGVLTERLAAAGATVVGVDAASEMVDAARARGLDARVKDGRSLDFDREFDAVFTNAVLHWMPEADRVLDGVVRALKPGGRFVGEFGGAGNVGTVIDALTRVLGNRGIDAMAGYPWFFPTEDDYRARLEAHGFTVDRIERVPRPTLLPGPLEDWLDTFAESFLALAPPGERAAIKQEVAALSALHLCDADGGWTVDYVRLRFAAHL
jgi:SAM-dependent methyltransferase